MPEIASAITAYNDALSAEDRVEKYIPLTTLAIGNQWCVPRWKHGAAI